MKVLTACCLLLLLVAGCEVVTMDSDDEQASMDEDSLLMELSQDESPGTVRVMTRNVYVGADVESLQDAETVEVIPLLIAIRFDMLQQTDFAERARALALEIDQGKPHLIGLQEVALIMRQSPSDFFDGNPVQASQVVFDYVDILLEALAERGLAYRVAVAVHNSDVELPMLTGSFGLDDIRLIDRDVILVRSDVQTSRETAVNYQARLVVDEEYDITILRGYAAVDALINAHTYRFVTTHLAAQEREDLRLAQATELLDTLAGESLPVILAGDFNTPAPGNSTYQFIRNHGYQDAWDMNPVALNPTGYTFGHQPDLRNTEVDFSQRIDFIFIGPAIVPVYGPAFVLGDELVDRTPSGLWPSDHGGVIVQLDYAGDG